MTNYSDSNDQLRKAIGDWQFFTLSFAAIVGVGWIVVLGDWLKQSGPMGAVTAFLLASVVMMLVGLCYAELVTTIPVSGGEIAYTYEIFGLRTSFVTGWFLALVYIATTSFEAISAGWIAGILFPALRGVPLYTVRGAPVMSMGLVFGLSGTVFLILMNFLGTKLSTRVQDILTYVKLGVAVVFVSAAILWGKLDNLQPLLVRADAGRSWSGILSVFITVTFWLSGFSVVGQVIEEKKPETSYPKIAAMLLLSIGVASLFYCSLILSCSTLMPWRNLVPSEFPIVSVLKATPNPELWTRIVLLSGLLGVFATWNSFFIASSRTLFALGRARVIPPNFAKIHPVFGSPTNSLVFVGVVSSAGVILGRGAITPIVNMVSGCLVFVYFLVAIGIIQLRRTQPDRIRPYRIPGGLIIPVLATLASLFMLFESFYLPYSANKGQIPLEWILFVGWGLLGVLFWGVTNKVRAEVSELERYKLILGRRYLLSSVGGPSPMPSRPRVSSDD